MKWLLSLGFVVVLVLGAVIVAPNFIDWNKYKGEAIAQVAKITGYTLKIDGDLSMAVLPMPHLVIEKVSVSDPKKPELDFVQLESLQVYVAIAPLLKGEVAVSSLELRSPKIALSKDAQGGFNFMTPEIEAMMNKGGEQGAAGKPMQVAFDSVRIVDGYFSYKDAQSGAAHSAEKINLNVSAQTLQGPFQAEGGMVYGGKPMAFKAKTGKLDGEAVSLNLDGKFAGADVTYSGVVGWGESPQVVGEARLNIASMADFMAATGGKGNDLIKSGVGFQGQISASPAAVSIKEAVFNLGENNFSGAVDAKLSPIAVKADLQAKEIVNLDKLLPKSEAKAAGDAPDFGAMLPETLSLPKMGAIDVALSAPGFIYNGAVSNGLNVNFGHLDKGFTMKARINDVPGKGALEVNGALKYAEKSTSAKTGTEIYTGPSLDLSVKGKTQNTPQTILAFTGMSDLPLISTSKIGVFDINGVLSKSGLTLRESVINLDDLKASVSGSLKNQKESGRQILAVKAVVSDFDLDALSGGDKAAAPSSDPFAALKNLALPMDVDADVTINSAKMQGQNISGLRLAAKILPNVLILENVGASDFAGAQGKISGKIGNLKQLSELDLNITGSAAEPRKVAAAFKVDTAAWPKDLGAVAVDVDAKGDLSAMVINAALKAMGGQVVVSGPVSDPLGTLSMNNMAVQVKHSSLKGALAALGLAAPAYASLSKPIDIKMNVGISGKTYTLADVKGDLSGTPIQGSAKIDLSGAKPYLGGDFQFGRIVLESGKGSGGGSSAKAAGGGKWSSAPLNSDFLHAMNAQISLSAASMLYEGWDMDKPSMSMVLKDGVMTLSDLKAGLYDGQIGLKGVLSSSGLGQPTALSGSADIQNVDMEPLVKSLTGNRLLKGQGRISLKSDVNAAGGSMAALIGSMGGQGSISGSSIVLDGVDVTRFVRALSDVSDPKDSALNLWKGVGTGGSTAFDTLDGAYVIERGVLTFQKLILDGPRAAIDTTGAVNFPQWTINTEHKMSVKDRTDVPPFTVRVSGPLDNPAQSLGQAVLNNYLQKKLQGQVGKLIGDKLGADNPLNGVLGNILGGGAAKPQGSPVITPTQPAPAPANDNAAPVEQQQQDAPPVQEEPAPAPQQITPEEAAKELLNNFLR